MARINKIEMIVKLIRSEMYNFQIEIKKASNLEDFAKAHAYKMYIEGLGRALWYLDSITNGKILDENSKNVYLSTFHTKT